MKSSFVNNKSLNDFNTIQLIEELNKKKSRRVIDHLINLDENKLGLFKNNVDKFSQEALKILEKCKKNKILPNSSKKIFPKIKNQNEFSPLNNENNAMFENIKYSKLDTINFKQFNGNLTKFANQGNKNMMKISIPSINLKENNNILLSEIKGKTRNLANLKTGKMYRSLDPKFLIQNNTKNIIFDRNSNFENKKLSQENNNSKSVKPFNEYTLDKANTIYDNPLIMDKKISFLKNNILKAKINVVKYNNIGQFRYKKSDDKK